MTRPPHWRAFVRTGRVPVGSRPFLDKQVASPYNQRDFAVQERNVECD